MDRIAIIKNIKSERLMKFKMKESKYNTNICLSKLITHTQNLIFVNQ